MNHSFVGETFCQFFSNRRRIMFRNWYGGWVMSPSLGRRSTKRASGRSRRHGSRACGRRLRAQPWLEALELRYAPTCSIGIQSTVLTVTCDNSGNTVTVDHDSVTSFTTINGLKFADSAFTSIKINGGLGHDTDNMHGIPAKTATISNANFGTVNVGNSGSVQGILGTLSIQNPPSVNTVTVDDSADPSPQNTELNSNSGFGTISKLAPGLIEFKYADTSGVTVKTGLAGQTVKVFGTGVPTSVIGNATETVTVGNAAGFVSGIGGALTVTNAKPATFTALTVNNSADTTHHTVTMGVSGAFGFIDGLAPAPITYGQAEVSAVTVNGGPNTGSGGFNVYTVANTANNTSNPLTTLNVGNAIDATVNVHATSGPLTVTSNLTNFPSNVGLAGSVQGIHGTLTFNNAVDNTVNLDDSADPGFHSVIINDTSVVGLAPAVINYEGHTGLFMRAGSGTNSVTINGNSGSGSVGTTLFLRAFTPQVAVRATTGPLNIFPDSGSIGAEVIVGSLAPFIGTGNTVTNIHGKLFDGESGSGGALVVDDESDTMPRTVTVGGPSGGDITGLAPATIQFLPNRQAPVDIIGGEGINTFNVTATPPSLLAIVSGTGPDTVNVQHTGGPLDVEGRGGVDTFNLGQASDGTASIQGTVTIGNQTGHCTVNVNDATNPFAGIHVTLSVAGTLGTVSGLGVPFSPFTLQYVAAEVSSLTINGGSHGNLYNVQNVPSGVTTILHTGSGNDTINVGNAANTLDGILGPLTVDGQAGFDTLNINDQGEGTAHSYTITATTVVRSPGGPTITYADIESLNLHPGKLLSNGPANNVVNVLGTDAGTTVEIDAVGGAVVNVGDPVNGTLDDLKGLLSVYGEDGSVVLNVNDQGSATGQNYSVAATTVDRTDVAEITYTGVRDLTLNAGAGGNQIDVESLAFGTPATVNAGAGGAQGFDLIRMRGGPINAPLTLHGQGNTHLGYVAYTSPVFVDVQTGQATDVKGGFTGINDLTGGQNLNILVGDGTENLHASGGHSLLISGGGNGTMTGSGTGDILIGGTTAYDQDQNGELEAILAYWTGSDDYATRVFNLTNGIGVPLLDATTVFDNADNPAANTITGNSAGQIVNLYYVTSNDVITDLTDGETVVSIGGTAPQGGESTPLTTTVTANQIAPAAGQSNASPAATLSADAVAVGPGELSAPTTNSSGTSLTSDAAWSAAWQTATPWGSTLS
jgi:hypothetical protein